MFDVRILLLSFLTVLPCVAQIDTNNNGMSDLWEKHWNNGQLFPPNILPGGNEDNDEFSNLEEAIMGTSPFDGASPHGALRLNVRHVPAVWITDPLEEEPQLLSPEAFEVLWPHVAGKRYTMLFSEDLSPGSWEPYGDPFISNGTEPGMVLLPHYEDNTLATSLFWRPRVEDVDSDGDSLTDAEEHLLGTDPTLADSDFDGLDDATEYLLGTNPMSYDSDGDGVGDGDEMVANTDPLSDQSSLSWRTVSRSLHHGALLYLQSHSQWDGNTTVHNLQHNNVPLGTYSATLEDDCPFPEEPPVGLWPHSLPHLWNPMSAHYPNVGGGSLNHVRAWLESKTPVSKETRMRLLRITLRSLDGVMLEEALVEPIDAVIPVGERFSNPVDSTPEFTTPGEQIFSYLISADMIPDFNRDGKIDMEDHCRINEDNPWRFWRNDDNDSGETEGNDYYSLPFLNVNLADSSVNGIRDLVDFFPLKLEIRNLLNVFYEHDYYLSQKYPDNVPALWDHSGLGYVEWPEANPVAEPGTMHSTDGWLRHIPTARQLAGRTVHPVREDPLTQGGQKLSEAMLAAARVGKGLLLLEGKNRTTHPLMLEIRKKDDGERILRIPFPVVISSVEDMFRWKYVMPMAANLTSGDIPGDPPNWPDEDRNDKHFVFVHGYNVSGDQSRGWGGEMFKRMFWSGSNARFSAFAWRGNQSQIPHPLHPLTEKISPDYQVNLGHAFGTAKSFRQFLDLIPGEKTVAAHSMGNIVVGSAMHDWGARPKNYIMLNSAAAKEAYDATEAEDSTQDGLMENIAWRGYPKKLRASEWHKLLPPAAWPVSDWRGKLTWRNRLRGVIENGGLTNVYNFYSSGEDVLNNATLDTPEGNNVLGELWLKSNRTWAVQEKRKGHGLSGFIHTSNNGGWGFNMEPPYDPVIHYDNHYNVMKLPSQLPSPLDSAFLFHLSQNPFFDKSVHETLLEAHTGDGSPGSNYARDHHNALIATIIPCTTFAAGRNALQELEDNEQIVNFNMNDEMKTDPNQWPISNENENSAPPSNLNSRPWLHSDIRVKAYSHNYLVFDKFIEIGVLNQND